MAAAPGLLPRFNFAMDDLELPGGRDAVSDVSMSVTRATTGLDDSESGNADLDQTPQPRRTLQPHPSDSSSSSTESTFFDATSWGNEFFVFCQYNCCHGGRGNHSMTTSVHC